MKKVDVTKAIKATERVTGHEEEQRDKQRPDCAGSHRVRLR